MSGGTSKVELARRAARRDAWRERTSILAEKGDAFFRAGGGDCRAWIASVVGEGFSKTEVTTALDFARERFVWGAVLPTSGSFLDRGDASALAGSE